MQQNSGNVPRLGMMFSANATMALLELDSLTHLVVFYVMQVHIRVGHSVWLALATVQVYQLLVSFVPVMQVSPEQMVVHARSVLLENIKL